MTEIAKTEGHSLVGAGAVERGGITAQDLEIPRCVLLQNTSPDLADLPELKSGQFINSVTKEVVEGTIVPLFVFKQYAKFDDDGNFEWATLNRNESRVQEGLQWEDGNPPSVTEFINVMVVDAQEMPMILSFKSSALRAGKQFLTLLSLKGKAPYCFSYDIGSKLMKKDSKSWYIPTLKIPAKGHEVNAKLVEKYAKLAGTYQAVVTSIGVEGQEKSTDDGEEAPF